MLRRDILSPRSLLVECCLNQDEAELMVAVGGRAERCIGTRPRGAGGGVSKRRRYRAGAHELVRGAAGDPAALAAGPGRSSRLHALPAPPLVFLPLGAHVLRDFYKHSALVQLRFPVMS